MGTLNNITAEEAAWLIKAVLNTSNKDWEPIELDLITPEYVSQQISQQRSIESSFQAVFINAKELQARECE
ncbi:hypothetical protein [Microbulbifer sp. THAF38]|uniref:hypothetical protein n=1 Tax=Microbulbifer sp. THAF38 TaxID=2587856 RepID=UPI001269284B|nr:hypothetical protein [Microbulbifer sp. THAF38]QFT57080.1 hypothetical protein FIU95_21245 [Microbulbifer sp. THAF38]